MLATVGPRAGVVLANASQQEGLYECGQLRVLQERLGPRSRRARRGRHDGVEDPFKQRRARRPAGGAIEFVRVRILRLRREVLAKSRDPEMGAGGGEGGIGNRLRWSMSGSRQLRLARGAGPHG